MLSQLLCCARAGKCNLVPLIVDNKVGHPSIKYFLVQAAKFHSAGSALMALAREGTGIGIAFGA